MDTELHKRLEEAADKYAIGMFDEAASRTGFIHGAEHGYKETIKQAKEWFLNRLGDGKVLHRTNDTDENGEKVTFLNEWTNDILTDFEADMNKLWEEQK